MIKYFYLFHFLLTQDLTELKEYWRVEFIKSGESFTLKSLLIRLYHCVDKYMFWYRLYYFMVRSDQKYRLSAYNLNVKLNKKYSMDINLDAEIGIGFIVWHHTGIIITSRAIIGKNFQIGSFSTIGFRRYDKEGNIKIGDNVMLSSHSMIFGQNINIGDNVRIGAMSFINKDIPNNRIVYTEKKNIIKLKET